MNKKAFIGFAVVTAALLSHGLHAAFSAPSIYVPAVTTAKEQEFSEIFRIFYYHVPSAWTAFLLFFVNFSGSVTYLTRRKPATGALAPAAGEVGVVFCTVVLVTGPIWARPVWGIWWTWDARLAS